MHMNWMIMTGVENWIKVVLNHEMRSGPTKV